MGRVRTPQDREEAVALLVDALAAACTTGEVAVIGSLAEPERADEFSDIDLRWTIPAEQAPALLRSLRSTLHEVGAVESLRVDPAERTDELLVFVRFAGWPLWWRVDLEVHSPGSAPMAVPDADPWSPQESACMGVVVTLKALARDRPDDAEQQHAHARRRVDVADVPGGWPVRIGALLAHVEAGAPAITDLVSRTRRLARDVLGE
jgi:hypothetical protein